MYKPFHSKVTGITSGNHLQAIQHLFPLSPPSPLPYCKMGLVSTFLPIPHLFLPPKASLHESRRLLCILNLSPFSGSFKSVKGLIQAKNKNKTPQTRNQTNKTPLSILILSWHSVLPVPLQPGFWKGWSRMLFLFSHYLPIPHPTTIWLLPSPFH